MLPTPALLELALMQRKYSPMDRLVRGRSAHFPKDWALKHILPEAGW
jgi:hypothetical protein